MPLKTAGTTFYACGIEGHCSFGGMNVKVIVATCESSTRTPLSLLAARLGTVASPLGFCEGLQLKRHQRDPLVRPSLAMPAAAHVQCAHVAPTAASGCTRCAAMKTSLATAETIAASQTLLERPCLSLASLHHPRT